MNVILLSGGSGRRLWPLSDDIRSKQFIPVFRRPDGAYESMVQRMYRGIKEIDENANVTVATAGFQVDILREQLGKDVGISVEPARRDTFPAIALATAYLRDEKSISEDESVVVCPVDPFVDERYFKMLKSMCERAAETDANLVLMGIEPEEPSEKLGYVIPEEKADVSRVKEFKEKPDRVMAEEYIKKGALWNGGVFAYRIGYVLEKAAQITGKTSYRELFDSYETVEKISFDYAVAEKEPDIEVLRFNGMWKDLGTFNTLSDTLAEVYGMKSGALTGKAVVGEDCENVHVFNDTDMPVLALGLKNVVIALSKDGLLVADKEESAAIKPFVDEIMGG